MAETNTTNASPPTPLVEGEDFYWEGAALVFTARYHLRRGYCCESGCRHCPYRELQPATSRRAEGGKEAIETDVASER